MALRLGWKTITGTLLTAVAFLGQHGLTVEGVTGAVGILLAGVGLRHAISKATE